MSNLDTGFSVSGRTFFRDESFHLVQERFKPHASGWKSLPLDPEMIYRFTSYMRMSSTANGAGYESRGCNPAQR